MERTEIFTAKTFDEAKALAAEAFGTDELDIKFEIIEQPTKKLFGGTKGDFRVRAIYNESTAEVKTSRAETARQTAPKQVEERQPLKPVDSAEMEKFKHTIDYIEKILSQLGVKNYEIDVKSAGDNYVLDITGENLGIIIGRRGETLDALQYLAILANNRGGEDNNHMRLVVDCNGYREKRAETLEALAVRTSNKVIKQGRRITLEPMNPYERRIIHSKVATIEGVYSNSIGDEPYRKVVISAELAKRRNNNTRKNSTPAAPTAGAVSNAIPSKSYKQSSGFSTSFEREYKKSAAPAPDISQDTADVEKNTSLYGKIEL